LDESGVDPWLNFLLEGTSGNPRPRVGSCNVSPTGWAARMRYLTQDGGGDLFAFIEHQRKASRRETA